MTTNNTNRPCPDCNVSVGELHLSCCDVEQCPDCGRQLLTCDCTGSTTPRLPWTGEWPGVMECHEFGWYARLELGKGYISCDKTAKGAVEDLNKLHTHAVWSKELGRFVLP